AGNPVGLIGTGTHFTTDLTVGQVVVVAWDSVDGPGTGRYMDFVAAIHDDTHATLGYYYWLGPVPAAAVLYLAPAEGGHFFRSWWGYGGYQPTNWNFYDLFLAIYRLYYRTGDTTYLNYARQLADLWWQWSLDHGFEGQYPRNAALAGQFARAVDGHPERFPGLYQQVYSLVELVHFDSPGPGFDAREAGYTHWGVALGAELDSDAVRHAQYCSWLNTITPAWISYQNSQGYWSEDTYSGNAGYPYLPPGTSPWRMDIAVHGLQATYSALADTTARGCNNPALAAQTLV